MFKLGLGSINTMRSDSVIGISSLHTLEHYFTFDLFIITIYIFQFRRKKRLDNFYTMLYKEVSFFETWKKIIKYHLETIHVWFVVFFHKMVLITSL